MVPCGLLIRDPEAGVKNIAVTSVSLGEIGLAVTLSLKNPNPVGIVAKTIAFSVYYQDDDRWTFLTSGTQENVAIRAGANEFVVPVSIGSNVLMGALMSAFACGSITLKVQGEAALDLLGISPKLPFERITTVPLKIP